MATPPPPQNADAHSHAHGWQPQQPANPYTAGQPGAYGPQPGNPYHTSPHQPGPYAPPPGATYGGAPHPPAPYVGPQPGPHPAGTGCRVCGGMPAVRATVRGHQGFLVIMRFLSLNGPFCRDCGLSAVREMSANTLWQGWWGPLSAVITPFTLLTNLAPWSSLRKLPAPSGGFRPPLDPGKSLPRRPVALVFLVLMALIPAAITALVTLSLVIGGERPTQLSVGDCVRNAAEWPELSLRTADCGTSEAEYKVSRVLDRPGDGCPAGHYLTYDSQYGSACLERIP
ncbi:hypothetical protein [Streptomyces sp. NPDC059828]|uniref:LppU/SCO3897 family protein n=1 Tax=Streptomyces sp. NPDC059828 TaxID=3346965 RepID=UPI00365D1898